MPPSSDSVRATEARARRLLAKDGQSLVKFRTDSRWYAQYGPYGIRDDYMNALVAHGLTLDELPGVVAHVHTSTDHIKDTQ